MKSLIFLLYFFIGTFCLSAHAMEFGGGIGYGASVLSANFERSLYEEKAYSFTLSAPLQSRRNKIGIHYIYDIQSAVYTDSDPLEIKDHYFSFNLKRFFGHNRGFIHFGADYIFNDGDTANHSFGGSVGGGFNLFLSKRLSLRATALFGINSPGSLGDMRRQIYVLGELVIYLSRKPAHRKLLK